MFLGGGIHQLKATFKSVTGVQQGDVAASALFCLATKAANEATQADIAPSGSKLTAGMDDQTLQGPPDVIFPVIAKHEERLAKVGLVLRTSKSKCYIHPGYRDDSYHQLRLDAGIKEGIATHPDGSPTMPSTVSCRATVTITSIRLVPVLCRRAHL